MAKGRFGVLTAVFVTTRAQEEQKSVPAEKAAAKTMKVINFDPLSILGWCRSF